jgi:hypothetical protein
MTVKKVNHKRKRKSWHKLTVAEIDRQLAGTSVEDRLVFPLFCPRRKWTIEPVGLMGIRMSPGNSFYELSAAA